MTGVDECEFRAVGVDQEGVDVLQGSGIRCWIDERALRFTGEFDRAIERAIRSSGVVIWMVSHHSVASDYVKFEMSRALHSHKPIGLVYLEPMDSISLPSPFDMKLANVQSIDASCGSLEENSSTLANELKITLRGLRWKRVCRLVVLGMLLATVVWMASHVVPRPPEVERQTTALEVLFQRDDRPGSSFRLDKGNVPLRTGDRVRVHAMLNEPLFAYLLSLSSTGDASVLFPPKGAGQTPVRQIQLPPAEDEWYPLTPPPRTETLVLLARREPVEDPSVLKRLLLSHGPPPDVPPDALLVASNSGTRLVIEYERSRFGTETVKGSQGFLDVLTQGELTDWVIVRAVAFPVKRPE